MSSRTSKPRKRRAKVQPYYKTELGACYQGLAEEMLTTSLGRKHKGKVQLILTSPPFALNHKKKYGNLNGQAYIDWLVQFAPIWARLLTPDGSIVIEMGNAWEPGRPVQSILTYEALLGLVKHPEANLHLCQQFICHNPARLPSPVQWVNIERIRLKDSFTHVWWMATSDKPKADNRRVLRPYSQSMKNLLERRSYNPGKRPSGHKVGDESFFVKGEGSIMPSVIEVEPIDPRHDPRLPGNVFNIANTQSNDFYHRECRAQGILPHPARMPLGLAEFFIQFLTDPGDLVLDPFAGSNTTGFCAERSGRSWVAIEAKEDYIEQSKLRFLEIGIDLQPRLTVEGGPK